MKYESKRFLGWQVAALLVFLSTTGMVSAVNLVQEFYLPMPESQIYQANSAIIAGTGSTMLSTFSIVTTGTGTVIHYDQWEDGYEVNLASPAQATTQIWGDGNNANGICPGFTNDPAGLPAGTVITLTNSVTLPRNPSTLLWDARDRVAANKALVISRAAWPVTPGPVFAGAAGVLSTIDYGTNYISPVGQNLTNGLFKYVGMFVMAAQNNTTVTIDPNGNGLGTTNIVLNQGESYLVNGGILKGGRVTSTKPIQADLLIGHVGSSYASDWFTLYPVSAWDNTYYTPVATAASGNPAYVYLYNPATNAIIINYNTRSGAGSFSVPGTNGVFQFQMPIGSGASFTSAGGQNFFAICTVGANAASDTAFNWGFTLVPKGALTTEGTVGWGPGSADGTVNGSPVWVTTLANTTIYVDYKGDHAGAFTDVNGNKYDTNFTMVALQSQKIFDPSKNQTGMRVYTVDGTLLTAAWGEDPDSAQPGNPYIDAGTTVLPFPVPVLKKTAAIFIDTPPTGLSVGDTIAYSVQIDNKGLLPLGNTVVIDAPSTNLTYVPNSTTYNSNSISDSVSGTAFPLDAPGYTIPVILSQGSSVFTYRVLVNSGGAISNNVNIGGTAIFTSTFLPAAPTNGASVSLNFTDINGVPVNLYAAGANVFVTMTNAVGNTASNTLQTISVTVRDLTHGDAETIPLTETGTNTGVFRNVSGLPSSLSFGLLSQDGTLNVTAGDILSVSYTDPVYGDSASNTAAIQIPALTKQLYLSVNGSTNGVQALNRIDPVAYAHSPTRTSTDLSGGGSGGSGVVVFDRASSNNISGTLTWTHITTNAANRAMLVGASFGNPGAVSAITYGGFSLTKVKAITNSVVSSEVWLLVNPPSGTNTIAITTIGSPSTFSAGAVTFSGVDQTTPLSATNTAFGNSSSSSLIISSATNQIVFDNMACDQQPPNGPGAGQTRRWALGASEGGGGSTKPGTNSVTMTWTFQNGPWVDIAVSVKPAAAGGVSGTNVTTFTQSPTFYFSFTMPSNNLVTITNYLTITNGSLAGNPDITARLQYNGTTFLTLTNPTYTAASNQLVWSALLSSNVTVSNGAAITYLISNGVSGVAFHLDYDSTTKPSKITLPASTVIAINTLGVYDAPYTNGNLVTSPVAGSTVYIRAAVSDPFGSYDITSLGLVMTGPTAATSFTNLLTATNVVSDDGYIKIYEYGVTTGPTTGGYNIAVTANEGTEGVTAVASTSITTTFLDLGTPSTTAFITGTGTPTNSYSANSSVCVRITDLNRNTNAAVAETIVATVSSSSGDSEILTFTETGTNTGIFATCLNTSTNSNAAPNDGTLFAPVGSILTASYTDPTDTSDTSSASATIQPAPGIPGVAMNKTIVSPSGGQIGVGQPVIYNLQVINTGSTTLPSLKITDIFPTAKLSYTSASLTPNTIAAGTLTWTNLGTLTPGQSTNLTVTFTTLATGTATNSATANAVTATNTSTVTLAVNNAAVNVTKVLLSPTNSPVSINSNVVFRITIQNVGNTLITTLPLQDTFSGAYYQYVSATIPPDGNGAGSLLWTNLTAITSLATNAIITNDITMKVVGQGSPANNTATVDFAFDTFGNLVPTASSTIGVITSSAGISGHVYNDINQSGVFTNGDTGLSGVTLQLFTDPNGDGNPADGALVQLATTDGSGYYELLNLTKGNYVLVETDLPGYSSSSPANNRLPFNLTNLTTVTNNNFFDYQPSPVLYATFSGLVLNDVNGNGTNLSQSGLGNVTVDLLQDVNSNNIADIGEPVVSSTVTATNGNYSFAGITPGHYVIRETDLSGYYSSGDSQSPNDNQIGFATTNGVVSTNNNFFDRLLPSAINDTNAAFYLVPTTILPLTNDLSPNGDVLTITAAQSTNGIVVINAGSTNLTFTPTNAGPATITYTASDGHGGSSNAVITVAITSLADIGLGKTAPPTVLATSNLTYTISVTNFGPSGASSLTVTDALPVNVTFVSASGNGVNNSGVVTWAVGTLTNNAVTNLTVTVTAPASGSLTNVANVGSPIPDPTPTNNLTPPVITTVTPIADIGLGKIAPSTVLATSNLTYTISVTNFGPSSASSVTVTDALPANVTFVSASGNGANNAGVVTWALGTLINNAVTNLTVTVTPPTSGSISNFASVNLPPNDPTPTNNITPPVITTVTPVADIGLGKTAPSTVFATSNLTYTISVTNFGPSSASSVTVTDALPANVTFVNASGNGVNNSGVVTWAVGTLTNNAVTNLTVTVTAPASGSLTNVATTGSPTGDPTLTNNLTPPVITTVIPVADIGLGKTAPSTVLATSNLTYTISVTNFGPSSASSVTVTDALPVNVSFVSASGNGVNNSGVVTWAVGTLTNNAVTNLTVTVTAPASGSLTNVATTGSPTGDPTPTNNLTPPVITTVTPVADIGLGKTAPPTVLATSNLTYTISVTNFGPSSASSVTVTDALPVNVTFVSASGNGTNNAGVVTWALGTLTNNAVTNLTVTVTAPASGSLTNVASGGSPTGDPTPTNNLTPPVITTITPVADVGLGKTAPATVLATSNLTYTISVTNFGPSSASSVTVTDALPVNVSFVSASGNGVNNSGVVTWALGTLTNNAVTNLTVIVTVPASGSLTNVATTGSPTGDPTPTNNLTPPVITTVTPVADIGLGKTAPATVLATSNLTYTISVTNFGPSSASSVTVTDALPVNVTFVSASGNGVNNSGVVTWAVGTLTNNAVTNLTVTVTPPTSGSISNFASVSTPPNDPTPTNNITPPVITTVTPVADIGLGKTASSTVLATSNLTYTISVTNFGPSAASSVTVTDALPVNVTFVSASGNGANNAGVVTWTLGTLTNNAVTNLTITVMAPASGSVTNVASGGSPTGDPTPTNNLTPPVITTVTPVADIGLGKTAPSTVFATSNLTYTISVTNFGPSSASSVTVTDALPANVSFVSASGNGVNNSGVVTWALGTLTNNAVTNLTVTVTAPASGSLTNVASGGSPTGDPTPTNNLTPPVITTVTPVADIGLGKTAPATVFATSNLTYTISVTNFGPSSASSVTVTDALPVNVIFVSASGNGTNNSGVVTWALGTLTNNAVTNLTVTVTPPTSGSISNFASVSTPPNDPTPTNNITPPVITTVTPVADIGLGKSGPAGVTFGTNFNYTISVTNFGPSTAGSLSVTDSLPAGLIFVSATPFAVTNASGQVVWTNLGNLASGATTNLTLTVSSTLRGTVTNIASAGTPTFDPTPTNNLTPPVITVITNIPPLANPDNYSMAENTTNSFSPLLNDVVRTPGGVLSLLTVTPTNGTAVISGNNVIFTPTLNFVGVATIGYIITDNVGGTNGSLITITVTNVPPVANPDSFAVRENSTNTFSPLINDTLGTSGGVLGILSVSPTNGTAVLSGTNVIFTPTVNFLGTATIGYTITDGIGGTNTSLITVTVTNIPPIANPDAYSIGSNSGTNTFSPLLNDLLQTPGGTLGLVSVSSTNGNVGISGTNVTFAPATNFLGVTTIVYVITDNIGGTNSSIITVTVTNRPPVALNDSGSTPKNVSVTIPALLNDSDPDGNALSIVSVAPTNGTANIVGTNVVFTPATNFLGSALIGYTITDGNGGTNSALITISVTNRPPVAVNDTASTPKNVSVTIPVLGNDSDPDGDALAIAAVSPTNGTASIAGTNVVFIPATNFIGTAIIGYQITDGFGGTNTALITVSVTNRPPVAVDDNSSTPKNVTVTIPALANDSDPDGDALTIVSVNPTNGTANIVGTNVVFTPATNFLGTATIGYTITDGNGGTNSALITINVTNRLPVAVNDVAGTPENVLVTIPVLGNDSDPDGDVLTIVSVSPTNGTANIVGTNVVFLPATNFLGTAFVGYTIIDGNGGTNSALIAISVTNRLPIAVNDSASTAENIPVTISPLGNDSDPDNNPLTIVGVNPTNGTANIVGTNVVFTPATNFLGTATVGYTITDGNGGTNSALITISVTNRPPVAVDDGASTPKNVAVTIPALGNDSDPDGNPLTIVGVNPTNGTANIIGTNVVFTPATNFLGTATAGYTITDGNGGTNSALITITVTNRPVIVVNDVTNMPENTTAIIPVLGNDSDPDGDVLTIVSVNTTNGTANIVGTNVVFTPDTNFVGTVTLTYTATDGFGSTNSGVIIVTVTAVNKAPVAINDSYSTTQNTALVVSGIGGVLTNDTDFENSPLTAVLGTGPTHGVLLLNTNGGFTYTPALNYSGPDSFTYKANDGATNSNTATVSLTVVPVADVAVFKTGPATAIVGSNITFTVTVTNLGPSTATNVVVMDQLPAGFTFVSASAGGTLSNNVVVWPARPTLALGAFTNYTVVVTVPSTGTFTNVALASMTSLDINRGNNDGSAANSKVTTAIAFSQFGLLVGAPKLNAQTGLNEERVTVTNTSLQTIAGFRLYVTGLRTGVTLYNATGTTNGVPYVQYNSPLDPSNYVTVILEFYDPTRVPFTNALVTAEAILPPSTVPAAGAGVFINKVFADYRIEGNTRFVVEFITIPGRIYTIIYSDDNMATWKVATPSVTAAATVTQWYDDGPPKTESKPSSVNSRFYRVIRN